MLGRKLDKDGSMRIEKPLNDHCLRVGLGHRDQRAFEFTRTADQYWLEPKARSCGGQAEVFNERSTKRVRGRGRRENCDAGKTRNEITEELQASAANLCIHPR